MLKRLLFAISVIISLTFLFSFFRINIAVSFCSTIFTVIGIFYSIGYSIALCFDYSKIENDEYAIRIRKEVKKITHSFSLNLFMGALIFIIYSIFGGSMIFSISVSVICAISLAYILFYLVYNFFRLERFKYDLDDKIRKEK